MSGSKEKAQLRNKGKVGLERQEERGAAREVLNKVLLPFANYLLRLTANFNDYSRILNGRAGHKGRQYLWKMANWAHLLEEVVRELMRLGHYFREDLLGVQVMMCYLLTLDLSVTFG
jgi:hypothetical protein